MSNIDVTALGFSPPKVPMVSSISSNGGEINNKNIPQIRSRSLSVSLLKRMPLHSVSSFAQMSTPLDLEEPAEPSDLAPVAKIDQPDRSRARTRLASSIVGHLSNFVNRSQSQNLNSNTFTETNSASSIPLQTRPDHAFRSRSSTVFSGRAAFSNSTYIPGSNLRVPHIPLEEHKLNIDPNPIVVRKKPQNKMLHTQNVSLKYLKPPPPEQPGDITIVQEPDVQAPATEPLRIVHKPPLPPTPPPKIFREKPPKPPAHIPTQYLTIPGKVVPPPPRQVIVERLPHVPPPPPDIIIERWLGYKKRQRRVVFRPATPITLAPAPKNVIVQWDSPEMIVVKKNINLGVERADPTEYVARNGPSLVEAHQLPAELNDEELQPPGGLNLAANSEPNRPPVLVGKAEALKYLRDYINCLRSRSLSMNPR